MPVTEIVRTSISPELAIALGLLRLAYGESADLRVVVRPEMFTHGATLAWLRKQVGAKDAHLCLSDGETVRIVPGMTNHVFFYRMARASGIEGFLRLRRRAPELLAGLATQVNTALVLVSGQARPPHTVLLPPAVDGDEGLVLPFFTSRGPVDRNARELVSHEPVALPASKSKTLIYSAASDAGLQSSAFAAGLINQIIKTYTHPDHLLIIGASPAAEPEDALITLLSALRRHAFTLPSGIPPNVFLHLGGSAALPSAVFGGQSRLVAYEADTFWQRTPGFYATFKIATVLRERQSPYHKAGLDAVLQNLTGRAWRAVTLPDAEQMSLARYSW